MSMEVLRATELWQQTGAYYVRIQAMAKKHHITLREEFDEHDGEGTKYIVLLDEDFPVATARMYALDETSVMIGRVVVLPEYRRRGLGTQTIEACEAWAREDGFTKSVVESRDNKTEFYEKLGYKRTGEPFDDEGTFRTIRMEKRL
ncbi:MAG: GNAT family N-acetyltransferase [Clostridia bacterium]|nr:GNAT family N-acetyltransferase [Clostridia bacterium]